MKKVDRVTPGVWREPIVVADSSDGLRVDRIHYPPGGHTHWHLHTREQVLYGELGRGWIQFEDGHPAALTPGQVIQVPVGARHWHGAASDTSLVHLAVTAGGDTVWLGEVSAEEYVGCDGVTAQTPGIRIRTSVPTGANSAGCADQQFHCRHGACRRELTRWGQA